MRHALGIPQILPVARARAGRRAHLEEDELAEIAEAASDIGDDDAAIDRLEHVVDLLLDRGRLRPPVGARGRPPAMPGRAHRRAQRRPWRARRSGSRTRRRRRRARPPRCTVADGVAPRASSMGARRPWRRSRRRCSAPRRRRCGTRRPGRPAAHEQRVHQRRLARVRRADDGHASARVGRPRGARASTRSSSAGARFTARPMATARVERRAPPGSATAATAAVTSLDAPPAATSGAALERRRPRLRSDGEAAQRHVAGVLGRGARVRVHETRATAPPSCRDQARQQAGPRASG